MDVWSFFWIILWGAVYVGYLFAVIHVLKDVFTDPVLSGWAKAAWTLAVILVPFLTLVVYLVVRGNGMRTRGTYDEYGDRVIPDEEPVASASPAGDIAQAKELLDRGLINAGEFDAIKNKALGNKF